MLGPALHELDAEALLQDAVDHAHEDDDAEVGVVPGIDEAGGQRRVAVARGRRDARDDRFEHVLHADAGLGAGEDRAAGLPGARGLDADDLLDLLGDPLGLGRGEVYLVDNRQDFVIVLDRLVDIGERLRLHPLRRVDHQQRALARGEAAGDLVGEVDMAGRVHQVELVGLAIIGGVVEAHGLRLDGDAPLALDIHVVEQLFLHLPLGQPAGELDQPVGERALPVVDVGDDGKIADLGKVGHCARAIDTGAGAVSSFEGMPAWSGVGMGRTRGAVRRCGVPAGRCSAPIVRPKP